MGTSKSMILSAAFDLKSLNPILPRVSQGLQIGGKMRWQPPMSPSCKVLAVAGLLAAGAVAHAAPPTVTPSPGYDARLQEQRAAVAKARVPAAAPVMPRHHKKSKGN
jgi:hypothetical protein